MAKDHYVPRFYLKNFSPQGKHNQIYLYRRGLAPALVGIGSVACDEDYYEDQVDKTLSKHETQSAPIIKRLLDAPKLDLSEKERKRLSAFVGTLANRTPNSQERLYKGYSFFTASLEEFFADKEDFFRSERGHGFSGTDEELEAIRLGLLEGAKERYIKHNPTKTDSGLIETALELSEDTKGVIEGRQWHLLESTTSAARSRTQKFSGEDDDSTLRVSSQGWKRVVWIFLSRGARARCSNPIHGRDGICLGMVFEELTGIDARMINAN